MPDTGRVEVTGGAVFIYPSGADTPAVVGMAYAVRALLAHGPLVEACRRALGVIHLRLEGMGIDGPALGSIEEALKAALALAGKGGA